MAKIGIMDSGAGGLSVLKEILRILPGEEYVYFADNAWCPYGEKSAEFIRERCREIVGGFIDEGADAVVLACNTATAAAVSDLRRHCPDIPFVGMAPAVKPAAKETETGVIGVLATAGTLKGSKYLDTKVQFASGVKVVERVGRGFVELVERLELDGRHAEETVSESLTPLLEAGADTIVLGCTHYPFLLPLMQRLAGHGIRFIDPAPAVARQLKRVLGAGVATPENAPYRVILKSSGQSETIRRLYSLILEDLQG